MYKLAAVPFILAWMFFTYLAVLAFERAGITLTFIFLMLALAAHLYLALELWRGE